MADAQSSTVAAASKQVFQHISATDNARMHNGNVYGNVYNGDTFHDLRSPEDRFLDSLCFPGMNGRHERPLEAFEGTYDWIFDGRTEHVCERCERLDEKGLEQACKIAWQESLKTDSYLEWSAYKKCQSLRQRDRDLNDHSRRFFAWLEDLDCKEIYWMNGKPGSGKSTLMNHVLEELLAYCPSKGAAPAVVVAGHFFWAAGGPLEKSIDGLIRNLLHQTLKQQRHLISELSLKAPAVHDHRAIDTHWRSRDLHNMLRRVLKEDASQTHYIFLIDGLDEAVGDRQDLIDLIAELNNAATKLCVASRAEAPFQATYGRLQHRCLCLQDLNDVDIDHYIQSRLDKHQIESEKPLSPHDINSISQLIRERAEGVFLWVRLAVDDIRCGIGEGDKFLDLQRRVERMPPELGTLMQRIFDNIDDLYRLFASRLMLLCLREVDGRIPLSWAPHMQEEHDNENFALTAPLAQITWRDFLQHEKQSIALVTKWTKGLMMCRVRLRGEHLPLEKLCDGLTVYHRWARTFSFVTFCHRSVRDIVGRSQNREALQAAAGGEQRTNLTACRTLLRACKFLTPGSMDKRVFLSISENFGKYARYIESEHSSDSAAEQHRGTEHLDTLWLTLIELWKELDRTGKTLFPENHWILLKLLGSPATSFSRDIFKGPQIAGLLAFTTDFNCGKAFSTMLKHFPQQDVEKCVNYWLLTAVSPVLNEHPDKGSTFTRYETDEALLRKLLELGANFNASITAEKPGHDYSVWQRTLLMLHLHICNSFDVTLDNGHQIVQTVERLLWYGADPDAQVWAQHIRIRTYDNLTDWKHPMQGWIAVADIFGTIRQEQVTVEGGRSKEEISKIFRQIHARITEASQAKARNQQRGSVRPQVVPRNRTYPIPER